MKATIEKLRENLALQTLPHGYSATDRQDALTELSEFADLSDEKGKDELIVLAKDRREATTLKGVRYALSQAIVALINA